MLFVVLGITFGFSQEIDKPEFTGENFSLEGALAMFKKSNSLEEFEKSINEENNNVNNLDLNNDGNTDYINVDDLKDDDTHVIVLSTFLSKTEKQDIATIGIEKTGKETAILQINGDDELYASNTIVEPLDVDEKLEKSKGGPNVLEISATSIVVNVWFWPSVRYIYSPNYVVWYSPHRWMFYPKWWKPWHPYRHTIFYTRYAPYRGFYHRTATPRVIVARRIYAPKRHYSRLVIHNKRNSTVIRKNNSRNNDLRKNASNKNPRSRVKTSTKRVISKDRNITRKARR